MQISDQTVLPVLQATSGATKDKENLVEADVVNVGTILSNVSVLEKFEQKVRLINSSITFEILHTVPVISIRPPLVTLIQSQVCMMRDKKVSLCF